MVTYHRTSVGGFTALALSLVVGLTLAEMFCLITKQRVCVCVHSIALINREITVKMQNKQKEDAKLFASNK